MTGIALCYVRKSSVRTVADEISPARQRAATVAEAERRGWTAELFADAEGHRSGRNENRPAWIQLKARLDDPLVKAVIVESLSRASRSIRDLFVFVGELEKRNIALISLKENIDTTTAMGRAFLGVIAVLNQFESDVASERMKMTIAFKRDTCQQHWGYTPFGCARQGSERKLVPSREGIWRINQGIIAGKVNAPPFADGASPRWFGYVDAVRACCELYTTTDRGLIELAARMNGLGYLYRDRNGVPRPFHTDDVRRMIDNVDFYAGHLPRRKAKDAVTVMPDTHPPILPRELCERVAVVHQARHSRWGHGGGSPKRVYLLTTLYCGECGSHLKGEYSNGNRYYRHSDQTKKQCSQPTYVRAEKIEGAVFDCLVCFQAPEKMRERIREKARRLAKQAANPEWENARRKIAEGASRLERLKTLFVDGEVDKAEYRRRKTRIEEQQQEANRNLQGAPPDVKTLEDLLPRVDQIAWVIREGEPIHQRVALAALFERVEILNGAISKAIPREWTRPFFNGCATSEQS
jgi:DNA invertase Pin-like site-specific DNA recombinase